MFLFRLFGLTLLDDKIHHAKYHKRFRIINLSWIFINLAIFYILFENIFTDSYTRMSEIIELANYVFALATMLVILVHVQTVNGKDLIWHEKLHRLDHLLRDKYRVTINHEAIGRWSLGKVLITFICVAACSAVNIFYAMKTNVPLFCVHNYFLKTIINLRYIQNFIRIDFIKHHILALHHAICNVVAQNTVEWKIVLVVDVFNRKHPDLGQKIDDVNDILMFKSFYASLFETMKLTENIFGWSLLTMISFTFIELTSNLYWFCIAILNLDPDTHLVDCIFEIIPSVVIISCLVYSSSDVNRKAKEVINLVPKLCTNTTSCYNKMIKEFLMQIHHLRIENSANDFFIVDFQLLSAVSFSQTSFRWKLCKPRDWLLLSFVYGRK